MNDPKITIDPRYSAPDEDAPSWSDLTGELAQAEVYALTTVMPDGTPHTVPIAGAWLDDAFWFCTGEREQKARNLAANPRVSVHLGSPSFMTGRDIVLRGEIAAVADEAQLQVVADHYHNKYPEFFRFRVNDGAFLNQHDNRAEVYRLVPEVAYAFTRGAETVQAKYDFTDSGA